MAIDAGTAAVLGAAVAAGLLPIIARVLPTRAKSPLTRDEFLLAAQQALDARQAKFMGDIQTDLDECRADAVSLREQIGVLRTEVWALQRLVRDTEQNHPEP